MNRINTFPNGVWEREERQEIPDRSPDKEHRDAKNAHSGMTYLVSLFTTLFVSRFTFHLSRFTFYKPFYISQTLKIIRLLRNLFLFKYLTFFIILYGMENFEPDKIFIKRPLAKMNPIAFVLLTLVVIFITYQIFGAILTVLIVGADLKAIPEKINTTRVILAFSQYAFLLFPVFILNYLRDNDVKKSFRIQKPVLSIFFLAIVGIIIVQPFLQVFLFLQNKIIFSIPFAGGILQKLKELSDSFEQTTVLLVTAHNVPEFIFIVFVIALTPAICEEFLFRGMILKNMEKATKALNAILMTGILFAVFHFNPFNLIPLVVLGYYLTFVTYYSGSIFTSMICHFLNNFISALSVFIFGKESISEPSFSGLELVNFIFLGVISLAFFIIVLLAIKKINLSNITTETQNV